VKGNARMLENRYKRAFPYNNKKAQKKRDPTFRRIHTSTDVGRNQASDHSRL